MFRRPDHSPGGAGEGTMTAGTAVLVMAGTVAWYLLPRSAPESPFTPLPITNNTASFRYG